MSLEHLDVGGVARGVLRRGAVRPVLVLHAEALLYAGAPVVDLLAAHAEVIAPTHPGFGHSARPDDFDTVYDLVHLYLDLLEHLPPGPVTLMGLSFGGWLAAEIAAARSRRVERLILVGAVGIKVGDRETPDILDVFNTAPTEVERRRWHEPAKWAPDPTPCPTRPWSPTRSREALCLYAWHPYMYNPGSPVAPASRCPRSCCGGQRRDRDAGLRARLRRAHPGRASARRGRRAPSRDRAARRARGARAGIPVVVTLEAPCKPGI
jgi:pimeloyl-ACP methyl ester carboxylesterase